MSVHFVYLESDHFILSYFFLSDFFANSLKALRANLEITLCLMPYVSCLMTLWIVFVVFESALFQVKHLFDPLNACWVTPPSLISIRLPIDHQPSTFRLTFCWKEFVCWCYCCCLMYNQIDVCLLTNQCFVKQSQGHPKSH